MEEERAAQLKELIQMSDDRDSLGFIILWVYIFNMFVGEHLWYGVWIRGDLARPRCSLGIVFSRVLCSSYTSLGRISHSHSPQVSTNIPMGMPLWYLYLYMLKKNYLSLLFCFVVGIMSCSGFSKHMYKITTRSLLLWLQGTIIFVDTYLLLTVMGFYGHPWLVR